MSSRIRGGPVAELRGDDEATRCAAGSGSFPRALLTRDGVLPRNSVTRKVVVDGR